MSGKDLINNHLSFCLYTHTAIWEDQPHRWPHAFRCNGHIKVNGEKMSKSLGEQLLLLLPGWVCSLSHLASLGASYTYGV